jgi:hypothetical protein
MKIREVYSSSIMVVGFVCLVLGIGNWAVGAIESAKYQALLRKTAQTGLEETYLSFRELDLQKNEEVLRRITDDRERYNAAKVKLNFFFVVLNGGRILFVAGAILTFSAALGLIRRDARSKIHKIVRLSEKRESEGESVL